MNIMVKLSTSNYLIWRPMMEDVLFARICMTLLRVIVSSLVICQIETRRN